MCWSDCAEKQEFCKWSIVLHLRVLSRRAKMWSGKTLDICADRTPTSRMRRLGKYTRRGRISQAPETDFFRYAQMLESCAAMLYESRKVVLEPSNASGRRVKGANVSHLVILPLKGGKRKNISSNNILSSLFRLKVYSAIALYPYTPLIKRASVLQRTRTSSQGLLVCMVTIYHRPCTTLDPSLALIPH